MANYWVAMMLGWICGVGFKDFSAMRMIENPKTEVF